MTFITPNSVSGINSITAQSGTIQLFNSSGGTGTINGNFTGTITDIPISGNRNKIINGDMRIDQRNNGSNVVGSSNIRVFPVDRFPLDCRGGGAITASRSANAPAGFSNSLLCTVTTADTSIAASDLYYLLQAVEGFNISDFAWGSASALPVTLSFRVRSSLTGTFAGGIHSDGGNTFYIFTYTINAANTWESKVVSIPAVTSGTWNSGSGVGVIVLFDLGSGSNYQGTAGTWQTGPVAFRTNASVSLIGTSGATFYITGVQLEVGIVATPFERRSYGQELALCQRYCEILPARLVIAAKSGSQDYITWQYKVTKRISNPIIIHNNSNYFQVDSSSENHYTVLSNVTTAGIIGQGTIANAEL
jgi:hypothetical protein